MMNIAEQQIREENLGGGHTDNTLMK